MSNASPAEKSLLIVYGTSFLVFLAFPCYYLRMASITRILPWIQIILSILLVTIVLLQQSAAGLGSAFGGGDSSATFHTRRGFERFLFIATFVIGTLFVLSAVAVLLVK
jgi:protein translocase SecG subunit